MHMTREGDYVVENRKTPISSEYDVIVAGGGPAGIGAALAAASKAMRILLIDNNGYLGGTLTAGLMSLTGLRGSPIRDIVAKLESYGAYGGFRGKAVDCEVMKLLLDRTMNENNVKLLYHTNCVDTFMEGSAVKGVVVENKSGRSVLLAKVVIDCTGDGDIAARAGARFKTGRESDGLMQPMTMIFKISNVEFWQQRDDELFEMMQQAATQTGERFKLNFVHPYVIMVPGTRKAVCQMTHIRKKSAVNAWELTEAEIEGRELVHDAFQFFKKAIPQFKDIELEQSGPNVGIRESRRIIGEYYLTQEDLLEGRQFDDGVMKVGSRMDIHEPDGLKMVCTDVKPYQIPYRCLVPKGVDNLLVAGRCISGSHEAMASYRLVSYCIGMGEAAGIAAGISIGDGTLVRDCDIGRLLEELDKRRKPKAAASALQ